jgi:hypothetical protein
LQEKNNYNDRELLLMLENLLFLGHRNGGNNRDNGRGRGLGDRGSERAKSNEEDDPEQHWNDGNQRRGCYAWNPPNEERFGKLKFNIPKLDGGSDPEALSSWCFFYKLQNLRQGNLSVEDYYREMEKTMIRANIYEDEEQSIAHFMYGLHRNIQCIVEFQQYHNLIELVHQASKAQRQLQQDIKMSRAGPFNAKGAASASKFTPKSDGRGIVNNSSCGLYSNARSTSENKWFSAPSEKNKPTNSSTTSVGSTAMSSGIQCFKCGCHGHVIKECPNNRTIIVNDRG